MEIAMRLLKEEYPPCPNCKGTGKDPNEEGRPEIGIDPGECEPCDGTGMDMFEPVALDERGFPIESYEQDDPNWQDTIETSEPMDLAWRLLKQQSPHDAKECPECFGLGFVETMVPDPEEPGELIEDTPMCTTCNGTGAIG